VGRSGRGGRGGKGGGFNASFRQQIPKFLQQYKHLLVKKKPRRADEEDDNVQSDAKAAAMAEYKKQVRGCVAVWGGGWAGVE